jgi:hypothetical protein
MLNGSDCNNFGSEESVPFPCGELVE